MRTEASNVAYREPINKKRRKSKKEQIHTFFKIWNKQTNFEGITYPKLAEILDINKSTAQKRCSDLCKEGKLRVNGVRDGHSVYFQADGLSKMTKPQAYNMAVKTFCDLETQQAIYKFVKNNT